MRRHLLLFFLLLAGIAARAQSSFRARIVDSLTKETLVGVSVSVKGTALGMVTNTEGIAVINNIPNGEHTLSFSALGYRKLSRTFTFPLTEDSVLVLLSAEVFEEEEVTVTSTRTNSRIEDVPVRIEVIGQEDLEEETVMQPANISMLLGETTGILTQPTSATSGNVSIRIQGLDGRYTQILKDGFPLYGGFSGSLSIMQIPPLDLRQAEVIKGSSSTLYGADAIAGIINFVSKSPSQAPENIFLLNQTSLKETDLGGFFSGREKNIGYTVLMNSVQGQAVDVNGDGFSDVPQLSQLSFAPRLFLYGKDSSQLMLGLNATYEDRMGGDMFAIRYRPDSVHAYTERNKSQRIYSQERYDCKVGTQSYLTLRNSIGIFNRSLLSGDYLFKGEQWNTYSEASLLHRWKRHDVVTGASLTSEDFKEDMTLSSLNRSYNYSTAGLFMQDDWHPVQKLVLEGGLRLDYQNKFGVFILPRLSALYHFTRGFSTRLGGGLGYKTPTIFSEEAEESGYRQVLPINRDARPERAQSANLDFTYKIFLTKELSFTLNQAFFYTRLQSPLIPEPVLYSSNIISFSNSDMPVESKGLETSLRLGKERFDILAAYTYTLAEQKGRSTTHYLPYVPQHRVVATAVYNIPGRWRIGVETFYTGQQHLQDQTRTHDYFVAGLMVARQIKHFTFVLNGENLLDVRQTRFEKVVNGPINNPVFRPIWMPLEGRVFNAVVRMNF